MNNAGASLPLCAGPAPPTQEVKVVAVGTRPTAANAKPVARAESAGVPRAERRRCPVCDERLSAYNPGPACYTHTVGIPWKGPNQKG